MAGSPAAEPVPYSAKAGFHSIGNGEAPGVHQNGKTPGMHQNNFTSSIIPFPRNGAVPQLPQAPYRILDDDTSDTRPIILFGSSSFQARSNYVVVCALTLKSCADLNGTLTNHTTARRGSGKSTLRPGLHKLRRLQVQSFRERSVLHHCQCAVATFFQRVSVV